MLISDRLSQQHVVLAADPNLQFTLKVLPALLVILLASALCGRLAISVRQPRVLGEMVAGVLLGPTLLGYVAPAAEHNLFPASIKPTLYFLGTVGLTLYMFLVGVGLDTGSGGLGAEERRRSAVLATSGIVPPLALGAAVGVLMYRQLSLPDVSRAIFALFVGGALAVTAFPMLARILYERGLENSRIGRHALLAASVDDGVAWSFLAFLTAVHNGHSAAAAVRTLVLGGVFAVVMLFVGARLLRPMGARVARTGHIGQNQMYIIALVVLGSGWFTDWIGIYSVFGGFVAGMAMPRNPEFREALHGRMMDFVGTFLVPVFFTFSGLNTKLNGFTQPSVLIGLAAMLGVGFIGKFVGCGLAAKSVGFSWQESWALGSLMNARGMMILIFINIGLAQHIISQKVFSILVFVALITSAASVPLFRWVMPQAFVAKDLSKVATGVEGQDASLVSPPAG
ncbi:cation:proton antiporter [Streptomyces polygonati]|uniref:Cation:proton antiporter n=1 Tax=Streptomyces polygonati TaxID=1617087 RepID=A0ABV8HKS1_9ACTN